MARRKTPSKTAPAADPEERLVEAALDLAARHGWRRTGLSEIAAEAGLPLGEAYALHRSKPAILDAFMRRIDAAVLAGVAEEDDESPSRDRLFDVLMRRYDALRPHRDGLRAVLRDSVGDPLALLAVPGLLRSMAWMLEAAGIGTGGWRGRLRVQLLAGLYLSVLRVFLEDDSADLARTMAALDRRLRRGEALLGLSAARRRAGRPAA
jgi:AcrR family transcriptional regulator